MKRSGPPERRTPLRASRPAPYHCHACDLDCPVPTCDHCLGEAEPTLRGRPVEPTRQRPLRPMSTKRRADNRVRRATMLAVFGEAPECARCGKPADDAHEPGLRSRGADPKDPKQVIPVCRACHDWIHANPKAATRAGFMRPSWGAA